jgi:predicted DNA binding protein
MKKWSKKETKLLISLNKKMMFKDIAKLMERTNSSVLQKAKSIGLKSNSKFKRKYCVDDNYFSNIKKLEVCYWAGFVAADGCALCALSELNKIDVPKLERKWSKVKKYKESKNEI